MVKQSSFPPGLTRGVEPTAGEESIVVAKVGLSVLEALDANPEGGYPKVQQENNQEIRGAAHLYTDRPYSHQWRNLLALLSKCPGRTSSVPIR